MIAFSGIDCSGKSTQIDLIRGYYEGQGIFAKVIWSRGGYTSWVEGVKKLIRHDKGCSAERQKAYQTDFSQNYKKTKLLLWASIWDLIRYYGIVIRFNELRGTVLVCDRYLWDAYIDFRIKYPEHAFEKWICWKILLKCYKKPDISVIFIISAKESMRRSKMKNDPHSEPVEMRKQRISLYMDLISQGKWQSVINAQKTIPEVFENVIKAIKSEEIKYDE